MNPDKVNRILSLFALLALQLLSGLQAGAQTDSLYMDLDSTTFTTRRHTSSVKTIGKAEIVDLKSIQSLPKMFGNTDPVNFIKNLPGVQTGSEYDSGIHIQGCDNSHNDISLAGVPVYGASHLFGLFSLFNPAHFSKMVFSHSSESNRLGGSLSMRLPDTLKKKVTGELSAGIMSAQGTLGIRTGKKSHLRLSARNSYINLLYGPWLKIENSPIRYGFGDYNLSWLFTPTSKDKIWLEGYFGQDNALITTGGFDVNLGVTWTNYTGAIHWEHLAPNAPQHHTIFISGYDSDGRMNQNDSRLKVQSYISNIGYKGSLTTGDFKWNAELNLYDVLPQSPESDGLYGPDHKGTPKQKAFEASLMPSYAKPISRDANIKARLRGNWYLSPEGKSHFSIDPDIALYYNAYHLGTFSVSYGMRHQHMFQTGLSNIGLPVEFWFMAGKYSNPQFSHQADFSYKVNLLQDAFSLSFNTYYKRLFNQIEYKGDLLDFFNSVYRLEDHLLKGDGWNYGMNIMIHKQSGALTGWVSYSLGRALRKFDNPEYPGIYPANHERIHELNAVASYEAGRWNFSGTFVCASGVPFTAPEYYYLSSGHIITKTGRHNGCRMRPYARLDLSVSYLFRKEAERESSINFSLYNATGRKNDVMYKLNAADGVFHYGPMSFFLRFVPSISYHLKF